MLKQGFSFASFSSFVSHPVRPVAYAALFMLMTHLVISRGVESGIERFSKVMMPMLLFIIGILVVCSFGMPGAREGLTFLLQPDFSKVTAGVVLSAMGQAFFSLSLAMGCLCTYASYFKEETNLLRSTVEITLIDVAVAMMAGLMIFPAAFSVNVEPDAGPSLVFMTMPNVFEQAFPHSVAYVVSVMFYLLLTIAALTSTISMHEIGTAVISQETPLSRSKAAWVVSAFCSVIGVLSAYSLSHKGVGLFGDSFFDNFDKLTANIMLPLGALCTILIVGWVMPKETVMAELTSGGLYPRRAWVVKTFYFFSRIVCPILIVCIFMNKLDII